VFPDPPEPQKRFGQQDEPRFVIPQKVRDDYQHNPAMLEKLERILRGKPANT
jgi:hypothetical protein